MAPQVPGGDSQTPRGDTHKGPHRTHREPLKDPTSHCVPISQIAAPPNPPGRAPDLHETPMTPPLVVPPGRGPLGDNGDIPLPPWDPSTLYFGGLRGAPTQTPHPEAGDSQGMGWGSVGSAPPEHPRGPSPCVPPTAWLLHGSPQCIVGNSPSSPRGGRGRWVWGVQSAGADPGPGWAPHPGAWGAGGGPVGVGGGPVPGSRPGAL